MLVTNFCIVDMIFYSSLSLVLFMVFSVQIQENMKAVDVIPLLTPAVMEKIEAVIQTKPKRPDSFR